ncbi:MAG: CHAT domain-containing protein, partial [Thiothrix litoralis]
MQHYTLELFRKDDSRFELRVLDGTWQTFPLIEQAEIDALLALAAADYRVTAPNLEQRGQDLFNWVDSHSNGWLRRVRHRQQPLSLVLDVREAGLRHLPWELLHDGVKFLCADPFQWFTPLRRVTPPDRKHDWQPQQRQLGVLFMASSPEDVQPVLDFEAEESGILQATARKPLDLQVEESGSLQGLAERLTERADSPDVIHVSGHANIDKASGQPVFLLEDEVGLCAPATPAELARTLRDANSAPRVVFLSGCRTGESSQQDDMLSFSEQVVTAGVPVVLGWALPVGDVAASQAAAALYDKLATGFDIAEAVALARQALLENHSPYWHLLRCYVDGSALNPLVAKGKLRVRPHDTPQQFLDAGGRVPVCARTAFIGRRRLLQRSLRSLRAWQGDEAYAEGILLYGMGGLGKSSAAARLIDRLRNSHEAVVCYGGLDETVLVAALGKALPKAQSLLNDAQQTLEQRLRDLFEPEDNLLCAKPLLLVFDDFEQNIPLARRKLGQADYHPASLAVLHTVLQAIHDSQSDTRVIVTSRFDVPVPRPCRLHTENPQTLHAADLKKKLAQLPGLQPVAHGGGQDKAVENALRQRAVEVAAGNPRLLEWLHGVLQERSLPVSALLDKLEQEEARFREDVLISELVDAQTPAVRHALACAALYRLPVALAAIEALNDDPQTAQHLQTAAKVGLVEIVPTNHGITHFVSPLLETVLAEVLSVADRQPLAAKASQHLFEVMPDNRSEEWSQEIVRLAVLGQEQSIAVEVGDKLAADMQGNNRYREAEILCQLVLTLGEDFRILTTLARAEQRLGRSETRQHFERAVALLPDTDEGLEDAVLRDKSGTLFNYGKLLIQHGRATEALALYQEQVLPLLEKLGDVREKAVTMGQIADILQARGQLDEALNSRQTEQLPVYEKLGDVRSLLVGR